MADNGAEREEKEKLSAYVHHIKTTTIDIYPVSRLVYFDWYEYK